MIFYFIADDATGSVPTSTQQTHSVPTFGTFEPVDKISLVNGSAPRVWTYSDFITSTGVSQSHGFIYDGMNAQNTYGTWEISVNARFLNEFLPPVTETGTIHSALFVWRNGASIQLGSVASAALTTTYADYVLNYGTFLTEFQKCDRVYIEIWVEVSIGVSSPQQMGVFFRYNSATFPLTLTAPSLTLERFNVSAPTRVNTPTRVFSPTRFTSPTKIKCS